jgi:hypothetical protein
LLASRKKLCRHAISALTGSAASSIFRPHKSTVLTRRAHGNAGKRFLPVAIQRFSQPQQASEPTSYPKVIFHRGEVIALTQRRKQRVVDRAFAIRMRIAKVAPRMVGSAPKRGMPLWHARFADHGAGLLAWMPVDPLRVQKRGCGERQSLVPFAATARTQGRSPRSGRLNQSLPEQERVLCPPGTPPFRGHFFCAGALVFSFQ